MATPFSGPNITETIVLTDQPDPQVGTIEFENAKIRDASTREIGAMPWLPQLPDSWARDIYDVVEYHERRLVAPNLLHADYVKGTAERDDDLAVITSGAPQAYLFSAEHATAPVSVSKDLKVKRSPGMPDAGTGGLAAALAEKYGTAVVATGRQTSNVPSVEQHPFKDELLKHLPLASGFLAIHGKAAGMFTRTSDRAEIHACLGLGVQPTEALRDFAHAIMRSAKDELGLYVVLSNDQKAYIQLPKGTGFKRNDDGTVKTSQLAGLKPTMTNNFSRQYLKTINRPVPSLQIELTNLLRLTPLDRYPKDTKSRIMGVALGYTLLERIVDLTPQAYRPEPNESATI